MSNLRCGKKSLTLFLVAILITVVFIPGIVFAEEFSYSFRKLSIDRNLNSVTYNGAEFIAVGDEGKVYIVRGNEVKEIDTGLKIKLTSISCFSQDATRTCLIVGSAGTLLKLNVKDQSIAPIQSPFKANLHYVSFSEKGVAVIAGDGAAAVIEGDVVKPVNLKGRYYSALWTDSKTVILLGDELIKLEVDSLKTEVLMEKISAMGGGVKTSKGILFIGRDGLYLISDNNLAKVVDGKFTSILVNGNNEIFVAGEKFLARVNLENNSTDVILSLPTKINFMAEGDGGIMLVGDNGYIAFFEANVLRQITPGVTAFITSASTVMNRTIFVGREGAILIYSEDGFKAIPLNIEKTFNAVSWRRDGRIAVIVGDKVIATTDGEGVKILQYSAGVLNDVEYRPGESEALAVGEKGQVVIIRGEEVEILQTNTTASLNAVSWKPDGSEALIVGSKGTIIKYNPKKKSFTVLKANVKTDLVDVAYNPSGCIALAVGKNAVILINEKGVKDLSNEILEKEGFNTVSWRPDGAYALIGGQKGILYLYDGEEFRRLGLKAESEITTISWRSVKRAVIAGGEIIEYVEEKYPPPSIKISAEKMVNVKKGFSAPIHVRVESLNGFQGKVTVSIEPESLPIGVTVSQTQEVNVRPFCPAEVTLAVQALPTSQPGGWKAVISAYGGGKHVETSFNLVIMEQAEKEQTPQEMIFSLLLQFLPIIITVIVIIVVLVVVISLIRRIRRTAYEEEE